MADGLVDALRRGDGTTPQAAIEAITGQSLAIGDAHVRVNQILASLAELELTGRATGTDPTATLTLPGTPVGLDTPPGAIGTGNGAPAGAIGAADANGAGAQGALGTLPPIAAPPTTPADTPSVTSSGPNPQEVSAALLSIVAEKTGYPADLVDVSMDLEADLGVDSIKRVQILGALRDAFPGLPVVAPEQLGELHTLTDVVAFVTAEEAAEGTAPASASSGPNPDEVSAALLSIVAEKTGYPADLVDVSMDLEADLGVDSIKRVQILGALRDAFPGLPVVAPEQLGELHTLADVIAFVTGGTGAPVETREVSGSRIGRARLELVPLPDVDELRDAYAAEPVAFVAGPDPDGYADALEGAGWRVVRAGADLAAWGAEEGAPPRCPSGSTCAWRSLPSGGDWDANVRTLAGVLFLAQRTAPVLAATAGRHGARAAFVTVTRLDGALGHRGDADPADALLGGVAGLVKTLRHEEPAIFARALDLAPALPDAAARLLAELADADAGTAEVGVDADGRRRTTAFAAQEDEAETEAGSPDIADDDVIVVTGGARGVTAACVRALAAASGRGEFLLLGRTEAGEPPAWAAGLPQDELKARLIEHMRAETAEITPREVDRRFRELLARREIAETLEAVAATGARARYIPVDVTDPAAVRAALAEHAPRVTGVVHGAGALADARLADKTPAAVRTVLGPKLDGLRAVLDALDAGERLRHLVLFASVAGVYGNAGQADYAMANQALGRLAASWKRNVPASRVTAIDWGAWDGGMVTPELREVFRARGVALLPQETGAAMFAAQFGPSRRDDVEVLAGPAEALAGAPAVRPSPALAARRDLSGLGEEPVIDAHRIGEHPVLPASAALGWLAGTLERANPGLRVVEVRRFDVQSGVVVDGEQERRPYWVTAEPGALDADGRLVIDAAIVSGLDGARRSHYRGTFALAAGTAPAPSPLRLPPPGRGRRTGCARTPTPTCSTARCSRACAGCSNASRADWSPSAASPMSRWHAARTRRRCTARSSRTWCSRRRPCWACGSWTRAACRWRSPAGSTSPRCPPTRRTSPWSRTCARRP
ncbi:SDR family NAD(P)-dependent oxidoreductase [Thermocatellispora tengchongensis]|uniref:SDR family NAD(P)-dependent oxidoreductase n=1 Tax=Thermocatellispora tengchongensis TaxID=1073253 RepID=UPI00362ED630